MLVLKPAPPAMLEKFQSSLTRVFLTSKIPGSCSVGLGLFESFSNLVSKCKLADLHFCWRRYAMEAVSKLELSGIVYPPCGPNTFGNAIPQGAALAPGAGGADAAQLAAMQQVRTHADTCLIGRQQ